MVFYRAFCILIGPDMSWILKTDFLPKYCAWFVIGVAGLVGTFLRTSPIPSGQSPKFLSTTGRPCSWKTSPACSVFTATWNFCGISWREKTRKATGRSATTDTRTVALDFSLLQNAIRITCTGNVLCYSPAIPVCRTKPCARNRFWMFLKFYSRTSLWHALEGL